MTFRSFLTVSAGLLLSVSRLTAQDASLVPEDIKWSKYVFETNHLIAAVSMRLGETQYDRFQYDRFLDKETITRSYQIYARPKDGNWCKSDDWGKIGDPVDSQTAAQLDQLVSIVNTPFSTPETHDPRQGGYVWKFIAREDGKNAALLTYEMSREHPRPNGVYPRFTFIQRHNDRDGALVLTNYAAQTRDGSNKVIPVEIQFRYNAQYTSDLPPDSAPSEVWITGLPFSHDQHLYFQTDKPVRDNPAGNIILLGATRQTMKTLLPAYMQAAQKHLKLRLYGSLLPFSGSIPGDGPQPNVEFITWKAHMPDDPDELPAGQKIILGPGQSMPGFTFKESSTNASSLSIP